MSAPTPSPVPLRSVDPDLLGRFVELLVRAAGDLSGPPLLLRLRADDEGIALGTVPVLDLYAELECATVPAEWHGAGALVSGRARSMAPGEEGEPAGAVVGRAVTGVVVWRDGTTVSALSIDGSEPAVQVERPGDTGGERCEGRVVDMVRRSLGLRTADPDVPIARLASRLWLHRVLATASDRQPVDRDTLVALEPPLPGSWEACREQCAEGAWPEIDIHTEAAAWMDAGMFAREALSRFPDHVEVLVHLAELLPPPIWRLVMERYDSDRPLVR